jgi:hypothetical protein
VSQRHLPIVRMLGEVAGAINIICALGLAAVVGALFGTFAIFLVNPIYHWVTGAWVDSVVYQVAISFCAAVLSLHLLKAIIKEKLGAGESRFIPYLDLVLGEFSSALKLFGLFSTLVALGGPFVTVAAFFEIFKNGVTVHEAFMASFFLGGGFSLIEICQLAYRRRGAHRQPEDAAHYLDMAEKYRKKADAADDPGLKAAFEAVARECMTKANALDPRPSFE